MIKRREKARGLEKSDQRELVRNEVMREAGADHRASQAMIKNLLHFCLE